MKNNERIKVLAVDENTENMSALKKVFFENGSFEIRTASGGKEVLSIFDKYNPDVVIMAVNMSEMDGCETTRKIIDKYPAFPVILFSSKKPSGDEILEGLRSGAVDYFDKPAADNRVIIERCKELGDIKKKNCLKEKKLLISEEKYFSLIETSKDWVWEVDENIVFTYSSPIVNDLLGYTPEEIIGKTPFDFMLKEEAERVKNQFDDCFEAEKSFDCLENMKISKDGHPVIFETSGRPVLDAAGNISGCRGIDRDISRRWKAENEKEKALNNLIERNKELKCLYSFSELIEKQGILLEEIFQGAVDLIPPAFTYPDITCAKIEIGGIKYISEKCQNTCLLWNLNAEIKVYGKKAGSLYICCTEERPESKKDPFIKEERILLNVIAERLGRVIERIQAEESVIDSMERFRDFMESATDGFVLYDSDFNLEMINEASLKMIKRERKDVIGLNILEMSPKLENSDRYKEYRRVLETGVSCSLEDKVYLPGIGEMFLRINVFKVGTGIGSLFSDITKRKNAERRNRFASEILRIMDSETEAENIIRNILIKIKSFTGLEAVALRLKEREDYPYYTTLGFPDYFVEAERYLCQRDRKGNIVRNSNGDVYLECMCGNILKGRTNPEFDFFTDGGSFWSNNTSKLLATTSDEDRQTRTRNRCNSEGYESVALIPLRSENDIIGLLQFNDKRTDMFDLEMIKFFEGIGYSIGLTLGKQHAEKALEEVRDQLYKSERLAATGRLAASVAHEINNPLQAIYSNLSFITKSLPEDFSENESFEVVSEGLERIEKIVNQLLDIHRGNIVAEEEIQVNEIIETTLKLFKNQLEIENIQCVVKLTKKNPSIKGNIRDFYMIFMNLLMNAQDAIDDYGTISVTTRTAKNEVRIIIEDSGCGISDEDIVHIFEPFYTTKSDKLGTGLGLSTSKEVIESFNGKIEVSSSPGKGTVFSLTFPKAV